MKIVFIPPYKLEGSNYFASEGHFMVNELVADMKKKGQLEGVEVDIDDGYSMEYTGENRDEEVIANVTVGFLKRVKAVNEMNKYDAVVSQGASDKGFDAARMLSKIPITFSVHSSVHVASLIGERFSIIFMKDAMALPVRHSVEAYGFGHRLASVRSVGRSASYMQKILHQYKKAERMKVPEVKKIIDDTVAQCVIAIEEDRVDSLIIGASHLQCFENEIRLKLDELGYAEIPLICAVSAAVEMAKSMANMKLNQASRAYPSDALKAKPKFR